MSRMPAADTSAKSNSNALLVLAKLSSILDALSLSRPVLSLADIREATGMPNSTVQRLVTNLTSQGFLDREADAYRIGMRMAYWAAPATRGMEILDVISPVPKTLRDTTGETACFFKAEQHYRVCVAIAETRHALRREMHRTASMRSASHASRTRPAEPAWSGRSLPRIGPVRA